MNTKEIKDLLKLVSELDLKEVRIKNQDFELRIRTDKDTGNAIVSNSALVPSIQAPAPAIPAAPAPAAPAPAVSDTPSEEQESSNYLEIKSPMVGTFYRSSSPDKAPYIQVGDVVSKGDVVCIIEAMKLFNEIESELSGKVVKILVDDSSPVEYDQALFLIEPVS